MPGLKRWVRNHKREGKYIEALELPIEDNPPKLQHSKRTLSAQGIISLIGNNVKVTDNSSRTAALWRAYAGSTEDLKPKSNINTASDVDFDSEVRATAARPQNKYVAIASSSKPSENTLVSRYGLKINTAAAASRVGRHSSDLDSTHQDSESAFGSVNARQVKIISRHSASSYVASDSQVSSVNGAVNEADDHDELLTPDTPQSKHEGVPSRKLTPHPDAELSANGSCISFNHYASRADPFSFTKLKGKGKKKLPDIRDLDWSAIEEEEAMGIAQAYGVSPLTVARANQARESHLGPSASNEGMQKLVGRWLNNQDFREQYEGYLAIEDIERQKAELRQQWQRLEEDVAARQRELERQRAEALARMEAEEEAARVALEAEEEAARVAMEAETEAARIAAERAWWRECAVCGDEKDPLDFPSTAATPGCEHPPQTCTECMASWMESEFDTKGCDGIKCPECPQTLEYSQVQECASPEIFAAYDKMAMRNALGCLEEFSWCLKAECGSGQLNIDNNCFMHCVSCGYKQCLRHKVPWHTGETCEQYEYRESGQKARDEEKKTEEMLDSMSKRCPNTKCGWRIQKLDGCDHMTCKRCRHEFCWLCLAAQADIRKEGNTAHAKTCKYHSHNLDIAWPFNAH